jgi:hypothetical protein
MATEVITQADRQAFEQVAEALENGQQLTFEMIGKIFGDEFWMMLVYSFMDAQDAARAIQGAINRLRDSGELAEDTEDEDQETVGYAAAAV